MGFKYLYMYSSYVLFELLDGSNMIPSQYRLAIAAIILIFDAIFAIYAIIESRKKNHSINRLSLQFC